MALRGLSVVLLLRCCFAEPVPLGCFLYGWKISDAISGTPNPVNATDARDCQRRCAMTSGCKTFGFQTVFKDCWLGGNMQIPTRTLNPGFISGPAKCVVEGKFVTGLEATPGCTASPSIRFPGRSPEESAATFTSGMVPVPLQCWPHYNSGEPAQCKGSVLQTLEDSATGWPGDCLGLHHLLDETSETCETSCRGNVSCSTFQVIQNPAGLLECWQGSGYDCFREHPKVKVLQAKRFMRGRHRVLKDLRGFEVTGLQYAFGKGDFGSDVEKAVAMCNHTCLSQVQCQAWRYSTGDGCWFDHGRLAYPPTSDTFIEGTEAAALVVAGAYIQRICEVPQDLAQTTTTTTTLKAIPLPQVMTIAPIETELPNVSVLVPSAPDLSKDERVSLPSISPIGLTVEPQPSSPPEVSTTAHTSITSTPHLPGSKPARARAGAPAPALSSTSSRFVRVLSSGLVFFEGEDQVLHMVPSGCDQLSCGEEVLDQCRAASSISEEEVVGDETGQEFSCDLLNASGGSLNWWAILFVVLLGLCCWGCCHSSWYYYDEIVTRYPGLDGYLPFQWCFGARNSFNKLKSGLRSDRTSRSAGMYENEDQFPLMTPPMAALPTQQMMGSYPPYNHYSAGMPSGFTSHGHVPGHGPFAGPYMEAPLPPTEAGYDLVTVTPSGLQVTPLGDALPAGVPIVHPAGHPH